MDSHYFRIRGIKPGKGKKGIEELGSGVAHTLETMVEAATDFVNAGCKMVQVQFYVAVADDDSE